MLALDGGGGGSSSRFAQVVRARNQAHDLLVQARAREAKLLGLVLAQSSSALLQQQQQLSTRLDQVNAELRSLTQSTITTHDPTDLALLSSSSSSLTDFCAHCRQLFPMRFYAQDLLPPPATTLSGKDTRAQDRKDVERDSLLLEEELVLGSQVGYEGVVQRIHSSFCRTAGVEEHHQPLPVRFARAVLHSANRTNAGGDAFEALQRHVVGRGDEGGLVFIAPCGSEPIKISCRLGVFLLNARGATFSVYDYGLIAHAESCTVFAAYAAEDLDRAQVVAKFHVTCVREFALPLPHTNSSTRDDGMSGEAMADYACSLGADGAHGLIDVRCDVVWAREEEHNRLAAEREAKRFAKLFGDDDEDDI